MTEQTNKQLEEAVQAALKLIEEQREEIEWLRRRAGNLSAVIHNDDNTQPGWDEANSNFLRRKFLRRR